MIRQYIKFFINGGILGVISWGLQIIIYHVLGGDSSLKYGVATALTYFPLIVINFLIQRKWIFQKDGIFWKFVAANISIMLLVSFLSPLCRLFITWVVGAEWGDWFGFALAAIFMSIPSFFLKRFFVFNIR